MNNKPIGVFDSGLGGISVLKELYALMPNENYIYYGDCLNAPYGTKENDEIMHLTSKCIRHLIDMDSKAVVIACNTATSVAANKLRREYDIPIIGIEPAVKPAAIAHRGGKIIVMATPM
ncbi:MAG: aspartate/glutamate racemase family protein, partial [Clostridia bacterium]|nr:aspartate/glutamate racemase family protein [Clostridia bacterium]